MNIKLTYLYRDAANYKQYNEVVFANPNELPIQKIQTAIIRGPLWCISSSQAYSLKCSHGDCNLWR